jgi:predicted ATP-grasp superfamily ATP-dependent carboligase
VYTVDPRGFVPVRVSRYCRRHFVWDFENASRAESVTFLNRIAGILGRRSILLPTTDTAALFVANKAAELAPSFIVPAQQFETAKCLADKYAMFELANRLGIATPAAFRPASLDDVRRFGTTARFPIVLKRLDRGSSHRHDAPMTYILRGLPELLAQYEELTDSEPPQVILQEYIPGAEDSIWMFNGYFDEHSDCLFGATGHKIRQSPVYTGASSLAVCRANAEVLGTTLRFMKAVGYRGILDIGYRYDARDGSYKVLDVNPRIGCTFRLFVADSGMDVARALYLHLTGQPVPPARVPDGRKWIVEDCDLASSIRYYKDGALTFSEWLRSFRGVRETALFSAHDPLPVLAALADDLRAIVSRLTGARRRRVHSGAATERACPCPEQGRAGNGD